MSILSGVANRLTTIHFRWMTILPGLALVAVGVCTMTIGDSAYAGTCNNRYGYGYANYTNYGRSNCGNYGGATPYLNGYNNYGNYGTQYYPVQSAGYCQYGGGNCGVGGGCNGGNNYGCGYGGGYDGGNSYSYGNNYGYQQPVSNQAGAASQAGSSSAVNDSGNSQNTNTNNPTATATANVVVNPASTVMRPPMVSTAGYGGRPSMQMPAQIMLPETGTMDPILRFFGLGGLVAASTGYAMSRRELMRSVFKRN